MEGEHKQGTESMTKRESACRSVLELAKYARDVGSERGSVQSKRG